MLDVRRREFITLRRGSGATYSGVNDLLAM